MDTAGVVFAALITSTAHLKVQPGRQRQMAIL
jgi:hypothetical protein